MLSKLSSSLLKRREACEFNSNNAVSVLKPHQFHPNVFKRWKNQCSSVVASGASIVEVRLDVWFGEGRGIGAWVD